MNKNEHADNGVNYVTEESKLENHDYETFFRITDEDGLFEFGGFYSKRLAEKVVKLLNKRDVP